MFSLKIYLFATVILVVIGILCFLGVFYLPFKGLAFRIGLGGWIIFLLALCFFHWHAVKLSHKNTKGERAKYDFDKGQIRRAILISMMFVFFALIGCDEEIFLPARFDTVLFIMLAFYFGGRAVKDGVEAWGKWKSEGQRSQE